MDKKELSRKYFGAFFGMLGVGILLNWIPLFSGLLTSFESASKGGLAVLIIILFSVLPPVLYFFLARNTAVKAGTRFIYMSERESIIDKIVEMIKNKKEKEGANFNIDPSDFENLLKKVPKTFRFIGQRLLKKIPYFEEVSKLVSDLREAESFETVLKERLIDLSDDLVLNKFLASPLIKVILAFVLNIAVLTVIVIWQNGIL